MIKAGQGLLITLTYNSGLFELATIRRMLNLWQALLAYLVAHPDVHVADIFETLDELEREERQAAAVEFKETTLQQLKNVKRRVVTQLR